MTAVQVYAIGHVLSVIALVATTFSAFANPDPARRKQTLVVSGILSLLALTGGMGLIARVYDNTWPMWVIVKLVCWLLISALAGIAFRKREAIGLLRALAILAVVVAVSMVYLKPV